MIGNKLREARQLQSLSLTAVAVKAKISAATLSRIETNKQGVDLDVFLLLARILKARPHDLLGNGEEEERSDPLAAQIAALKAGERAKLWREMANQRRIQRGARRRQVSNLGQHVEELAAQIELLREEIESVKAAIRKRR
ncbi:MAG TPA: helix-turn-helix transcriptional regulator [Thermoanaerobaculia bacterium]